MSFQNKELVQLLQDHYVTVTVDCWRMKRATPNWDKNFYDRVVQQRPDLNKWSSQGWYVCDHRGQLLQGWNSRKAGHNLETLKRCLKDYQQPTAAERQQASATKTPARRAAPEGITPVAVFAKITKWKSWPEDQGNPGEVAAYKKSVGRDTFWIRSDEIRALRAGKMSESLIRRLFIYQLDDFTRGEPSFWDEGRLSNLSYQLKQSGPGKWLLVASGRLSAGDRWFNPSLQGQLEFEGAKLTRFDLAVRGPAQGAGEYCELPPTGEFELTLAFRLPGKGERLPKPQGLKAGRSYLGQH